MKYCCVKYCDSKPGKKNGISFHEFPVNHEMRQKWISVVPQKGKCEGNAVDPWDIQDTTKVCSLHFLPSDYKPNLPKLRRLNSNAVPSVFPRPKRSCGRKRYASESSVEHTKLKQVRGFINKDSMKQYKKERALQEQKQVCILKNCDSDNQSIAVSHDESIQDSDRDKNESIDKNSQIADPISEHQYCKPTDETNLCKDANLFNLSSDKRIQIPKAKQPLQENNNCNSTNIEIENITETLAADPPALPLSSLLLQCNNTPSTAATSLKQIVLQGTSETLQNLLLQNTPVILKNHSSASRATSSGIVHHPFQRIKKIRHFGTQASFPVKSLEPYIKKYKLESKSAYHKIYKLKRKVATLEKKLSADRELKLKFKKQMKVLNITQLENDAQDLNNVHANFLLEQLKAYGSKSYAWQDVSVHHCMIWYHKYPESYRFVKQLNILKLPSDLTLERNGTECREVEFPGSSSKKKEIIKIDRTELSKMQKTFQENESSANQKPSTTIYLTEDDSSTKTNNGQFTTNNQSVLKTNYVISKENNTPIAMSLVKSIDELNCVPMMNTFLTTDQLSVIQEHRDLEGNIIETIELPTEITEVVQHPFSSDSTILSNMQKLPQNTIMKVIEMVQMPVSYYEVKENNLNTN